MALSLHDFFNHYKAKPHQIAAIQELQEAMPVDLLDRKASWYETWKAGGRIEWLLVPYYNQYKLQEGRRKCFTAAAAMIAGNYARVLDPHSYDRVRAKYGDTTEVDTHLNALWELKLKARFFNNATPHLVEQLIDLGVPVGVGWLQHGNVAAGEKPTGGHWSVIIGYTESFLLFTTRLDNLTLPGAGTILQKLEKASTMTSVILYLGGRSKDPAAAGL